MHVIEKNIKSKKTISKRASGATKPPVGSINIALIQFIPELINELGFDELAIFKSLNIDIREFKNPYNTLSFDDLGRLLEYCAVHCQCQNFGLLVGQRIALESMDILGVLVRNAPTVGAAMQIGEKHMQLNDRGAVASLIAFDASQVALTFTLLNGAAVASHHIIDAATVLHFKLLKVLCGPQWQPNLIRFAHKRPENHEPFRAYFGLTIEFDAEISCIVFDGAWLSKPVAGANAELFAFAIKTVEKNSDSYLCSFSDRIRRTLHPAILSGSVSTEHIALMFGINERTLRRRLKEEGVSLRELENEVRCELSCQLLRDTSLSVLNIANILGYSDGQVFARAFRLWMKMSPSAWRQSMG
jgi:AraC-like DNA-binding protein